jgi:hypothetical protein
MSGTGSLGITVAALVQIASAHVLSTDIWVLLSGSSAATIGIAGIGLLLDYKRAKLEIDASVDTVRRQMDAERIRLVMYQALIQRSAEAAGSPAHYQDLILADALHLEAERNGAQRTRRSRTGVTQQGETNHV